MPSSTTRRTIWVDVRRGLGALFDRLIREPVLIGAAVQAQMFVRYPHMSAAARIAVGAWIAWGQRALSTSKRTADENVEVGKYVGGLEASTAIPTPEA